MKKDIFDQYTKAVAKHCSIDEKAIFTASRSRDVCDARHLLFYLCANRPMRQSEIAKYMQAEGSESSKMAISYGVSKVTKMIQEDSDYGRIINNINSCITP